MKKKVYRLKYRSNMNVKDIQKENETSKDIKESKKNAKRTKKEPEKSEE